jgi:hypothetical protein
MPSLRPTSRRLMKVARLVSEDCCSLLFTTDQICYEYCIVKDSRTNTCIEQKKEGRFAPPLSKQ